MKLTKRQVKVLHLARQGAGPSGYKKDWALMRWHRFLDHRNLLTEEGEQELRAQEGVSLGRKRRTLMAFRQYTFIADPGHGWLEIDWTDLKNVGLNPSDFSRYSYRKRNKFYLEEDCDAPKFLEAYKTKYGSEPTINEKHGNGRSFVRDLEPIY